MTHDVYKFIVAYDKLAAQGKADAVYGAEFNRVLASYLATEPAPTDLQTYIYEQANGAAIFGQ